MSDQVRSPIGWSLHEWSIGCTLYELPVSRPVDVWPIDWPARLNGLYASQYERLSYGLNPFTNHRHSADMAGNAMQHSPWGGTRSQLVYRLTARCETRLFVTLFIRAVTDSMIPVLLPYFFKVNVQYFSPQVGLHPVLRSCMFLRTKVSQLRYVPYTPQSP
jgi:hypothetical protein